MCGRFKLDVDVRFLETYLHEIFAVSKFDSTHYSPKKEVRPSDAVLALIHDGKHYRVGPLKWGYLPRYAKHEKDRPLINARGETLAEKQAFKEAYLTQRCIILADSFYEWQSTASGKQPMRISLHEKQMMPLAGLWRSFQTSAGQKVHTCAIITVAANAAIKPIHDRMPLILDENTVHFWLKPPIQDPVDLERLIQPYPDEGMQIEPVDL